MLRIKRIIRVKTSKRTYILYGGIRRARALAAGPEGCLQQCVKQGGSSGAPARGSDARRNCLSLRSRCGKRPGFAPEILPTCVRLVMNPAGPGWLLISLETLRLRLPPLERAPVLPFLL